MMSYGPLSLWVNFIIFWVELTRLTRLCFIFILLYVFVMYNFIFWMSILVYVFVLNNFVLMTFNIIIDFYHAHLCTNEYPYPFGFLSCTSLYKWLSVYFWIFLMHISVRMIIHILLYFCHAHLCMNDYRFYSCMGFRHNLSQFN